MSNRRFIERLKEWNCVVGNRKGEWVYVEVRGTTVKVRPADFKKGNDVTVFNQVLDILDVTWEQFMGTDLTEAWKVMGDLRRQDRQAIEEVTEYMKGGIPRRWVDEVHAVALQENEAFDRRKIRKEKEAAARRQKEKTRAMQHASALTTEPSTPVVPNEVAALSNEEKAAYDTAVEELNTPNPERRPRLINRVFDVLVEAGEPMSNNRVAELLKINREQATGALLGLVRHGVVERVKPGVYRATHDMAQQDTLRLNVQGGVQAAFSQPPAPAKVSAPSPAPSRPVMTLDLTDAVVDLAAEENTINEVLDLMFPNGLRIRAADLALLEQWRRLTAEVIRRVG